MTEPSPTQELVKHPRWTSKVEKSSDGCWQWLGAPTKAGYGLYHVRPGLRMYAHRIAYEAARGPIPPGLVIDHLCRNRMCVNPDHLEAVSNYVNTVVRGSGNQYRGRTHCPKGHELSGPVIRSDGRSRRNCVECARERAREQASLIRQAHRLLGITQSQYRATYGGSTSAARRIIAEATR